jgi:Flp pilus assembly protein TadG
MPGAPKPSRPHVSPRRRHAGAIIIYIAVIMVALTAMVSLAVDFGHVEVAKIELQRAADAIARYSAAGLADDSVVTKANTAATDNLVDGAALTLQGSDIQTGIWDSASNTFTPTAVNPNAVRIAAECSQVRNTGIATPFAGILGRRYIDIHAVAIATYTPGVNTILTAPSSGDPWLAGMPDGTTANTFDAAPANSPAQVSGIAITPGGNLTFSFTGHASYYPGTQPFDPDGNTGWIINNYAGREHGMSQLIAPLTAVVGVFLDDTQPDLAGAPPPDLDFSTDASRDFATLSPQLRQPFFIGNGLRADGVAQQKFVVPAGATRFYLGIMDGQQWSDNSGALTSSVVSPVTIQFVK